MSQTKLTDKDIQAYAMLPDDCKRRCREIMETEGLSMRKAAAKAEKEWHGKIQCCLKELLRVAQEAEKAQEEDWQELRNVVNNGAMIWTDKTQAE